MKKVLMILLVVTVFVGLVSCGSSKESKKAQDAAINFVKVEYEKQFDGSLSKYDDALAKAHDIIQALDELEHNLESLPELMKSTIERISKLAGKASSDLSHFAEIGDDPEAVMELFKEELRKLDAVLVIHISQDGTITPKLEIQGVTGAEEEITAITNEIIAIFQPFLDMKNNMTKLVNDSKSMVTQLTDLSKSAKDDFKGKNALKAPKAIKALTETAKTLGEVPARMKSIGEKIPGVVKGLSALA